MAINFYFDDIKPIKFPRLKVKRWISIICDLHFFKCGSINIIFCSEDKILEINRQFLNHDFYTDIITFDETDYNLKIVNGELYISVGTVLFNANQFNQDFLEELYRVIIHGFLHLMGFKDKKANELLVMRENENRALMIFNKIE